MKFKRTTQIISFAVVLSFSATSWADFQLMVFNITANDPLDAAIGEAQIFITVSNPNPGANQVLFTFENIGSADSSITDVYFDDGDLLAIAFIDNSDLGVLFTAEATPGELPGGNNVDPPFDTGTSIPLAGHFSADSDPPVQPNGVNPGESLGITFDLVVGGSYDNVISQLTTGQIRVGVRMQGYESEGSEAFIINQIPAPAALVLGMVGLGMVGWMRRRLV